MHDFETEDSVIDFGQNSFVGEFFQVSKKFGFQKLNEENSSLLYEMNIFLS